MGCQDHYNENVARDVILNISDVVSNVINAVPLSRPELRRDMALFTLMVMLDRIDEAVGDKDWRNHH